MLFEMITRKIRSFYLLFTFRGSIPYKELVDKLTKVLSQCTKSADIKIRVCVMSFKRIATIALAGSLALGSLASCTRKEEKVGAKSNPLKMFFIPSDDTREIALNAKDVSRFLEKFVSQRLYGKDEGFYIKSSVPTSYIAVVEAFGTGRADFAALNTFSYILLKDKKKYPSEAFLKVVRGHDETSYKAQILARADSGINSIEDLKGKKFAYTDPASTSGYILPSIMFKEKGIKLGEEIFAGRHDTVATMVYQGQVDAGATYYSPPEDGKIMDARKRIMTQFPDVGEKVKIIGFSRDIPNAPWVIRDNLYKDKELYEKVKTALQEGVIEYVKTPSGKDVLMKLYSITGMVKANDEDYKPVRKMFQESDFDVMQLIKKK